MKVDNQIFGLASVVSYIRSSNASYNGQEVLQALSYAFYANSGNGTYLYNLFSADTGLAYTKGFASSNSNYMNLENSVGAYESNVLAKVGISAIIYGYATYPNIDESKINSYINSYNTTIKNFQGLSNSVNITNDNIDNILSSFSIAGINSDVLSSPSSANSAQTNVNYNWYDSSAFFDFTRNVTRSNLIRDIESQYYYLSGELIYANAGTVYPPCIKTTVQISSPTGSFPITVLKNYPCVDASSYIGPKTGVKFLRVFSDGPTTSGYFDAATTNAYINFDKGVLSPYDYSSNVNNLYSYIPDANGNYLYLYSGAQLDIQGYYNSGAEYGYGHTNYMVAGPRCQFNYAIDNIPLMNMHQGNNSPKLYVTKYDSTPGNPDSTCIVNVQTGNWTGWKFALLELKNSWTGSFSNILTNPQTPVSRYLKRALNLNNENLAGTVVSPYSSVIDGGNGTLICPRQDSFGNYLYVGPPQLNSTALFPGFAFYQDFYNQNFPSSGRICVRPAFCDESNNYQISNFNIFTGIDTTASYSVSSSSKPKIPFFVTISSTGLVNYDDIFKKCLSIGDNFQNQITFTTGLQANAGFIYTGYAYFISGVPIGLSQALTLSSSTVGSTYSTVQYVTGYNLLKIDPYGTLPPVSTGVKSINNLAAQIITGDTSSGINYTGQEIIYQYFNTGVLGSTNYQWNYQDDPNNFNNVFAPVPPDVQNNPSNFQELYTSQPVENYNPRYYSGPYLSYNSQILYPNAQACGNIYNFSHQGFPSKVKYSITIKEEAVREAFYLSGANYVTQNIQIIRAGSGNQIQNLGTLMATPFVANNRFYTNTYDFTKNPVLYPDNSEFFYTASLSDDGLVDSNYLPSTDYCTQLNLNNTVYPCSNQTSPAFVNGVRYTGQLQTRKIYTGNSLYKTILNTEPFSNSSFNLYWGYKNTVMTGEFLYCPPIFDLGTYSISPSPNLSGAFYYPIANIYGNTINTFSNNGSIRYGNLIDQYGNYNGKDPFFYQYVGGRSGANSNLDGGTNNKGIIGDAWYDLFIGSGGSQPGWGGNTATCYPIGGGVIYTDYRYPKRDAHVFLNSLTSTGLNIYAKGLYYNPYYFSGTYKPFTSSSMFFSGLSSVAPLKVGNEYYFKYDLKNNFYPLKSGDINLRYLPSGLTIGPFDRDVELCVMAGNSIYPYGSLLVNDEVMAVQDMDYQGCPTNYIERFQMNSGIDPSKPAANYARNVNLTTFNLIPAGSTSVINISGNGNIGLTGASIITIRPRTILGPVDYTVIGSNSPYITGDTSIMDNFNYIDNGTEKVFSFASNGFEGLQGKTLSSQTTQRIQILYPKPTDPVDFDNFVKPTIDSLGNKTYPNNPTLVYWSKKTPTALFTGFREISRLYIGINQMTPEFGAIPYQNFKTLVPSGQCSLSGVFAYSGQAESAVVSQGFVLSGTSIASALSGIYNPIYISDILSTIPVGIQTFPSGTSVSPILPAPSYMKQRKNYLQITGNDTYINTPGSIDLNYNKFLWPALSDLAILNPEVVYEAIPPDDGSVFPESHLTFSASQGQNIGTGFNPVENVTYLANPGYFILNSTATNASYNTGKCISTLANTIINSGNLSGILAQQGSSLTMNLNFNTGQHL